MNGTHVLSLCDRTGNMVRPWARAGYIALAVDVQHDGVTVETVGDGAIVYIGADVRDYEAPTVNYAAGFGFPPCTDLAVSGARWFEDKGLRTLADAIDLVGATQETLAIFNAVMGGATEFYTLAVSPQGETGVAICGLCQHTVAQFCDDLRVVEDCGEGEDFEIYQLEELIGPAYSPSTRHEELVSGNAPSRPGSKEDPV
jgi:hypothetical protein